MKKILCLIAGLLLITMMMASCGEVQMPPTESTTETTAEGSLEPVEGDTATQPGISDETENKTESDIDIPDDPTHTHTFDEHWTNDETAHWHASSCEHGDLVRDKADHVDGNGDDVCDVCGFRRKHTHTYEDTWTINEKTHYHKNTCGHDDVEKYRQDEGKHVDKNNDAVCDVCGYDYGHTHTYDTDRWTLTEGGHWHAPTCDHTIPGIDLTDHVDADNDSICDGCGYDYGHTHTYSDKWTYNDDYHWHDVTCEHTIPVKDKNAHTDTDGDKICDECGYQPPHIHAFDTSAWVSDSTGHWYASTCGHDVRKDEAAHEGYEESGICHVCDFVVFRFFAVKVTLPEESVTIKAPDGSAALSFYGKEGTDVIFHLTLPRYIEIINMKGAVCSEKSEIEGDNHTYTITVPAIQSDVNVSMELKKNANVQVIVDNAEATLTITEMISYGKLTFQIPSAGRYIIYSANNSDIKFMLENNEAPQDDTSIAYVFDATVGEMTIDYSYFTWKKPTQPTDVTFNYVVAKVEKNTQLDTLEGSGCIMPTNYAVNITFKLPSAGFYQITSNSQVSWNSDVLQPHVFLVPEDGDLTHTIGIKYDSDTESQFIFDWVIEKIEPKGEFGIGDTSIVAKKGTFTSFTFTAPRDGSFFITTGDRNAIAFRWLETEYGKGIHRLGSAFNTGEMKKGDTGVFLVITDPMAEDDEIAGDIPCIAHAANCPTATNGYYPAIVGVENAFESGYYEDIEYTLFAENGDTISIDGGKTWHNRVTVLVSGSGAAYYQVKSASGDGIVKVKIEKASFEFTLSLGTNDAVTLAPGQEYDLILTGNDEGGHFVNYILSWSNTNITVSFGHSVLTSGQEIVGYSAYGSSVTVMNNTQTEISVVFTLEKGTPSSEYPEQPDVPDLPDEDGELVLGKNDIEISNGFSGMTVVFTADAAGTYTFSYAADEENGVATIETAQGAEALDLPTSVTLAAGESYSFLLGTADFEPDTVTVVVSKS